MTAILQLHYSSTPLRPPAAWLIVGCEPAAWLEELSSWQTPLAEAQSYVLPGSDDQAQPCGLFVLGSSPPQSAPTPRVFPYGVIADRLYLPVNARLDPAVLDSELDELLGANDRLFVWHPRAGLIALAPENAVPLSDFLAAPPRTMESWDAAVPGLALNSRLLSIEPDQPASVSDVLDEGRGDIGSRPLELDDLPPSPHEPSAGVMGEIGRTLQSGFAKAVSWLTSQVPHTASQRNWINDLEDWANQRVAQAAKSLDAARHRELVRLLHLLRTNPDEGMRFALSLEGAAHRGQAPPSGQLGRRDVDFRLDQLAGGRPADLWDVSAQHRQELLARYRELAAREISLGRHRRAAYIFATLLNDLKSAAVVLANGGHWREAAVLYEQRLQQPVEAARCLRQGGLWAEAIALYEQLGQHEIVGDLYQQLQQPEEAAAAWRQAVDVHLAGNNHISAARILEMKLGCPTEAYERLIHSWPEAPQATACLNSAFPLLGRHAWHELAKSLIGQLSARKLPAKPTCALVEVLARQAVSYPDASVREQAADQTRKIAAGQFGNASDDEAQQLLDAVGRLVPDDRLLRRDTQRFVQDRRKQRASVKNAARSKRVPYLRTEFQLPAADWKVATATDDALFAAGYRDREVIFLRMAWRGGQMDQPVGAPYVVPPSLVGRPILLAADPLGVSPLLAHVWFHTESPGRRQFAPTAAFPDPLLVGSHPGISAQTVAMRYTGPETFHALDYAGDHALILNAFTSLSVQMLAQFALDLKPLVPTAGIPAAEVPFVVREEVAFIGIDNYLCFARFAGGNRQTELLELSSPIRKLAASAPFTRTRVAAAQEQGAVLMFGNSSRAATIPFATEMSEPEIALTRAGWLIAASANEIEVYRTSDGKLLLHSQAMHKAGTLLAVLSTSNPNQFALVGTHGNVVVYDITN